MTGSRQIHPSWLETGAEHRDQYLENVRQDTFGQTVALVEGHINGRKTNKPQTNKDSLTGPLIYKWQKPKQWNEDVGGDWNMVILQSALLVIV